MFDEKLKLLLKKNNVTAYKVAKDTGISQGLMGEYKNGIKTPSSKNIVKIAKYFNVPVDYLLDRGNNNPNGTEQVTLDSTEIAKRIKETAKIQKLNTGEVLSECGLGKNALSNMQSGGFFPRLENIVKIADHLNCSVDYLLGRTDIPSIPSGNTVYIPVAARGGGVSYLTFTLDEYMKKIKTSKEFSAPPENAIPLDE